MKKNLLAVMMMGAASIFVAACGGSDNSNDDSNEGNNNPIPTVPEQLNVNSIQILDANNQPIHTADIQILSSAQWGAAYQHNADVLVDAQVLPTLKDFNGVVLSTDNQGLVKFNGLNPDQYYILIKKGTAATISTFVIKKGNTDQNVILNVPLSCVEVLCNTVPAIVGTLSGQVIVNGQPIKNAQVGLSGGAATNGAFVTALTDEKGHFNLSFNVSDSLVDALKNAKLLINADGYQTIQQAVPVYSSSSFGNQFTLIPVNTSQDVVWRETFEPDSPTAAKWQKQQSLNQPMWNLIQSNHGIQNNLVNKAVTLAPNDSSLGNVPIPPQGSHAYWYGDVTSGNFIGLRSNLDLEAANSELSGGTSIQPNLGAISSPAIDLSQVKAPISLSFKTWWEIESVNPNSNGYDLMDIQVSTDGGLNYKTVARLNPLSDPQSTLNRAPLPFTNFGFNQAPSTSQQESISLDEFAGQADVRLKFEFLTVDELYNGFRGWMIDDIVIQKSKGSFPLFLDHGDSQSGDVDHPSAQSVNVAKMLKSYSSNIAVTTRWANIAQRN